MNSLGKYHRALHYVNSLEDSAKLNINDFKQIQELKEKLKRKGARLRSLEIIRIGFFVLLYSSVASAFTSFIPGSEIITSKIIKFGSVIGSTLSLIIIGLSSKAISIYALDLNMITSHLISLYTKNGARTQLRKKKK